MRPSLKREGSTRRPSRSSSRALRIAGPLLTALLIAGVTACEPEPGDDVGVEEGTDTLEMGADREEPIVPPTEGDTGMLRRDTAMAGEDTVQLRGTGDTASGDTARGRNGRETEATDETEARDTVTEGEAATRSAAESEDGQRQRDVEDTLAAVRPQPSDGEDGAVAADARTLRELESLIDETVRDLQRAQELLRQAMERSTRERGTGDTTSAPSSR